MDIVVSQEQGRVPVTLFRVKGRVDASSYEQLETRAREAVDAGSRNLLLDLSAVDYMSSAGVRALNYIFQLLRGHSEMEGDAAMAKGIAEGTFHSPHVKLLNPSKRVLEVLKLAGFDMLLDIQHDLKQAVDSF